MPSEGLLRRYAELAVRVGVDLQLGQDLLINCYVEHAPLARAVGAAAYEAGARADGRGERATRLGRRDHGRSEARHLRRAPRPKCRSRAERVVRFDAGRRELARRPARDHVLRHVVGRTTSWSADRRSKSTVSSGAAPLCRSSAATSGSSA